MKYFLGKRPNAKSLKCYGCICYIHVPSHMVKWGSKLDEKSIKCIHLGIDVIDGGYRLMVLKLRSFMFKRC